MIIIDGSHGEGGGQVLRTSLTLAVLTGQAVQIERIRAGRSKPGLAAQHLTALRAAAAICDATVSGDKMGSSQVHFCPGGPPRAGDYVFDVAQARRGGSAGAVSLVLQTVLLPLALAPGASRLTLRGGTHVPWSPSFVYLDEVYLPALGLQVELTLNRWGFYPVGGGEVVAQIQGSEPGARPLALDERGPLQRVWGVAVASNLPAHIPQRMAGRAQNVLSEQGVESELQARRVRGNGPGAGIFISLEFASGIRAGFMAYGRKGLPAERVAEAACRDLLKYCQRNDAPVDEHLADQLIVPLSVAAGESHFATSQISKHLRTNMWVVEQFELARFQVIGQTIAVHPQRGG